MSARITTSTRLINLSAFLISRATRLPRPRRSIPSFAPLTGTPCGSSQNFGDPFAFYDHMADRWVISDFAFPGLPSNGPFYECIAVSQTSDPVSGGWFLYAVQHSDQPGETMWVGDYPKMALWSEPQPGGAYHLTVNLV